MREVLERVVRVEETNRQAAERKDASDRRHGRALMHFIPSVAAWLTLHYLGQEQLKACEPYVVILYATKSEAQIPP
jgi:hypothetical protein